MGFKFGVSRWDCVTDLRHASRNMAQDNISERTEKREHDEASFVVFFCCFIVRQGYVCWKKQVKGVARNWNFL